MDESDISFRSAIDPYFLLKGYARDAKIKAKSYTYSENYYRNLNKLFTYPIVVISAIGSVLGGISVHHYVSMGLSLLTLLLTGSDRVVNTRDREQSASHMRIEYTEIAKNIKLYIYSNNRSKTEIKEYTSHICELMNKWNSIAPPVFDRFVKMATMEYTEKKRNSFQNPSPKSDKQRKSSPEEEKKINIVITPRV